MASHIMSNLASLMCGVPQGSVLGHVLFLIRMSPLGKIIQESSDVSYHFSTDDFQLYCVLILADKDMSLELTSSLVTLVLS